MVHSTDGMERLGLESRKEWRRWLEKNGERSRGVWLIIHKKGSGERGLAYEEAVEEAVAFGWIDSKLHRLDDARFEQWFTPRKPGGSWSNSNKERVERLTRAGLMAPAGLAKVAEAKRDGSWTALDEVEELREPEDLRKALGSTGKARKTFESYSPSLKRQVFHWITSAKRPATREKRIAEIARLASLGEKPPW